MLIVTEANRQHKKLLKKLTATKVWIFLCARLSVMYVLCTLSLYFSLTAGLCGGFLISVSQVEKWRFRQMQLPVQDHTAEMTGGQAKGQAETIEHLSLGLLDYRVFVSKSQMAKKLPLSHLIFHTKCYTLPDVYSNFLKKWIHPFGVGKHFDFVRIRTAFLQRLLWWKVLLLEFSELFCF